MRTMMSSCIALFGASLVKAHHHAAHHNSQNPHFTRINTSVSPPPSTVLVTTTTTAPPTSTTIANNTTRFVVPDVSPMMKQIIDKVEMQQIEEATDVFYRMFYSGHVQSFDNVDLISNNESPIKASKSCVNCNEERRYQDFDYQFFQDDGATKTCYEIKRSDEGYGKYDFEDISSAGNNITSAISASGVTQVTLSTSFPFFDRNLVTPTVNVFVDGYISFSETTVASGANTMPNPSEDPFDIIAPFFQSQTITGTGALLYPSVYYTSDDDETIIQWETNEGVTGQYTKLTQGGSIYQLKIESSGKISFAYKLATCEIPSWSTVQVGVKPLENELASGYRTSFFQSACQDGGYLAPCPGLSVVLKRVKCSSLIGQTGIRKPKVSKQKKLYSKDSAKSSLNYTSKKQRYVDYFHEKSSKIFQAY